MGREVRRVPATWEHPRDGNRTYNDGTPKYRALHDGSYAQMAAEWDAACALWLSGFKKDYAKDGDGRKPLETDDRRDVFGFVEYEGDRPSPGDYMPDWPEVERTHYQMYENVSEGTPISPVCESPEALARWLTDNDGDACAGMKASYEAWLRVARGGFAPSMVISNKGIQSGVEALGEQDAGR